jgi:predicted  nucleic acid-binding Zn-ribbon protein
MTQPQTSWHHCGKCGEVYKAAQDEVCPACARNPLPARKKINVHTVDGSALNARKEFSPKLSSDLPPAPKLVRLDSTTITDDEGTTTRKSSERKRKHSTTLIKFLIGWAVGLILVAGFIKWQFNPDPVANNTVKDTSNESLDTTLQSKNLDLVAQAYPSIVQISDEFFQTSATESLTQLCRQRPRLAITVFNDGAKATLFRPESAELLARNVIRPGGLPMIETIWSDSRNRKMEVVYAEEDGRWVIDWESYAKSSTLPWTVFQSSDDEAEGTFRFLVRERLADQTYNDLQIRIVFYEPAFFHGGPAGMATPEFLVDRKSRNGRLITAALEARKAEQPLLGSIYPQADPPNMARVCVKIRRSKKNDEKVFELVEVLACHWLGIEHPGVDLTDTP